MLRRSMSTLSLLLTLGFLIVLFSGCGGEAAKQTPQSSSSPGPIGNQVGDTAPDFSLKDTNGNTISLSSLRGKVVFLNMWDSFCAACQYEMPQLQTINNTYGGQAFKLLAINLSDDLSTIQNYFSLNNFTFTTLIGQGTDIYSKFGIGYVPTNFILDKIGVIRLREDGSSGVSSWSAIINQLLSQ
ncbi:MAG: TlpA disulfide reductase family protein [bacterium]